MPHRRWIAYLAAALGLLAGAHFLDWWSLEAFRYPAAGDRDWGRGFRVIGYAPTWGLAALALWLEGRGRDASGRVWFTDTARSVVFAVVAGGLLAEVLKLLIRRERPDLSIGEYVFRSFQNDPWSTRRLGMPSSHTMVAFAGATALSRRLPRAAPIFLGLATGCGLTRLFAQAHFLSDVVLGAIGGTVVGYLASRPSGRTQEGRAILER